MREQLDKSDDLEINRSETSKPLTILHCRDHSGGEETLKRLFQFCVTKRQMLIEISLNTTQTALQGNQVWRQNHHVIQQKCVDKENVHVI